LGILLAVGSALLYAIYIIIGTDVMRRVSPVQSSAVIFATAGIGNGVLMTVTGPHIPATGRGWAAIAVMVVITTLLPVVAFLSGLKRIGPTTAAMLSTLEPVVTVLLASWWLQETLTPVTFRNRVQFYRRHLPHWQPPGSTLFVTFRLAGSLPRAVIEELQAIDWQREAALSDIENDTERWRQADLEARRAFGRWDRALDCAPSGHRWLAVPMLPILLPKRFTIVVAESTTWWHSVSCPTTPISSARRCPGRMAPTSRCTASCNR
jgi:hypothetical protein